MLASLLPGSRSSPCSPVSRPSDPPAPRQECPATFPRRVRRRRTARGCHPPRTTRGWSHWLSRCPHRRRHDRLHRAGPRFQTCLITGLGCSIRRQGCTKRPYAQTRTAASGVVRTPRPYCDSDVGVRGSLALTALSITCQTSWSSRFSFQMPYAVPSSTGGTATSPIAPLTAASTHS